MWVGGDKNHIVYFVLLRGTLHGSWSLVCLYWAPGSVVNFLSFFLSFISNSASGGRGLLFFFPSHYFWFLVLLSHILLFFHLGERAMKGLGTAKKNTTRRGIFQRKGNGPGFPFTGGGGHMAGRFV